MGNVADSVRAAAGIQEALLALAEGIDAILENAPAEAEDPWGAKWHTLPTAERDGFLAEARAEAAAPVRDEAAIAELRAQVAASAGEDRQALEAALRLAEENGYAIDTAPPEGVRPEVSEDGDNVTVDIPPATPERQADRVTFGVQNRLWEFQTGSAATNLAEDEFLDAYAKGGPAWLYYGDRLGVLSMPIGVRQMMIADVGKDSPALALEMGRDVLMFRGPQDQSNMSALNA